MKRRQQQKIDFPANKTQIQKYGESGLHNFWRPKRDSSSFNNYKLYARHHDRFIKLQRAIKNTIRLQSDPAGQIINLTQKIFSRETFKFLNKNLNFVPTQNKINKKELHNQLDKFYRRIKLKAHFQDTCKQADLSDDEYRFKIKSKHWVSTKIHHTVDTFIEATKKDINEQLTKTKKSSYNMKF